MTIKRTLRRFRLAGLLAVALPVLALAAPLPTVAAQNSPIRHIVVIYLENQSFDSVLGYWCDRRPTRCPDGGMPARVTLSNGAVVTPAVSPDIVPNVDHSVPAQMAAKLVIRPLPPAARRLAAHPPKGLLSDPS